ncbi:MAG TPA: LamG domain-containing protein [Puia sp.]
MRRKFTSLSCSLLLLLASASAQNTDLTFDGSTNWVTTTAYVVPNTGGDFTVELWAFVPTLQSGLHEFVSQGTSGDGFYLGYDGATGMLRAGDKYTLGGVITTNVPCPTAKWFHVALVKSGATATFYLNGVPSGTSDIAYSVSTAGSFFTIGQQFSPFNELFGGSLDEIRVWNIARTATEISHGMYGPIAPSTTGLVADYNLNEGTANTVNNTTAVAGQDGTIQGTATWSTNAIQVANNAVAFDGADDRIQGPGNAAYDITTGTVEAWINPSALDATNREIVGLRDQGSVTRFSFHVSSTTIGLWNGTAFTTIPATVPLNTWTHLAFVCNGTTTEVYQSIAGTNTDIGTINAAFGTASQAALTIGASNNGTGIYVEFFQGGIDEVRIWNTQRTAQEITDNMNGTLTGTETGLVAQFPFDQGIAGGDNTGLAYSPDNSSTVNVAELYKPTAISGFDMTGTTSNYITSPLVSILPVDFQSFTAVARDGQAYLQWQTGQEENSKQFIIERSTDGSQFSDIGTLDAAGTSHTLKTYSFTDATPATGVNYYRIKEMDLDSRLTYSSIRALHFSPTGSARVAWTSSASGQAEITLISGSNEFYQVIGVGGQRLQQGRLSGGKLYLSGIAGGMYIVNITTQAGEQINTRILVK